MKQKTLALLAALTLLAAALALAVPALFQADDASVLTWDPAQEIEVAVDPNQQSFAAVEGARTEIQPGQAGASAALEDDRVAMLLRGRVIDRHRSPVANAKVYLEYGRGGMGRDRGGRARRVPDPVVTGADGTFAFQGQLFRGARVSLHVVHRQYAPGFFDRSLGEGASEVELGELIVSAGGEVAGRVTDLDGFAIPAAEVRLQPENDNRLRWVRDREELLPAIETDRNGLFRFRHVAEGAWRVTATARRHQQGQTPIFPMEEELPVDLEDIRLGPGFELAGSVHTALSQPVGEANVSLRAQRGGRDFRTKTDAQGRFHVEHLPGAPLDLQVEADGYLRHEQRGIDPTQQAMPLQVILRDGLRITGMVADAASGRAVTRFAVRATRVRGLPREGGDPTQQTLEAALGAMRDGTFDLQGMRGQFENLRVQFGGQGGENMRMLFEQQGGDASQIREQLRNLAGEMGRGRGEGARGGPGRGDGGRGGMWGGDAGRAMQGFMGGGDTGPPGDHPDGRFTLTGLQEGVYAVVVHSPDHTRWRSAEIELRVGQPAPDVVASVEAGLSVRGVVLDGSGRPMAGARAELRTVDTGQTFGLPDMGGTGDRGGRMRGVIGQFFGAGIPVAEARTDSQGRFAIQHVAAGHYRVTASADNYDAAASEPFDLQTDVQGVVLTLGALARLEGNVLGLPKESASEARVMALPVGEPSARPRGSRPMADVAADGSYRFEGLSPGGYLVRAFVGPPAGLMRELMPLLDGSAQPDVSLKAGETSRLDVHVQLPQTGTVQGTVTNNGMPARDYRVELRREDNAPASAGEPWRRFQGNSDDNTSPSGRYTVENVQAGTYLLTVSSGRRSPPLHTQQISVVANQTTSIDVALVTCTIKGRLRAEDEPASALQGNVQLLPGLTEFPQDFNAWRREHTFANARIQEGAFESEALAPGQYLVVVNPRGRDRTTQSVFLAAGQQLQLELTVGGKQAVQPGAPGTQAPQPGPGGRGPGGRPGGGGPGGGRRGG